MKKKYQKPSIISISLDTENIMVRASEVIDGEGKKEHIDKSDKGDMWTGAKEHDGLDLWEE